DSARLYVAVAVSDDRVLRTGRGSAAREDNLLLGLRARSGGPRWSARIFPGTRGFKPRVVGGGKIALESTLTEDGWTVELGVPLSRIPGWGPATPLLRGELVYRDVDSSGGGVEETRRFAGSMHFSGHVPALYGLIDAIKMSVFDFRLDELVDLDGLPGTERVFSGGPFIGVLGDSFGVVKLPVTSPAAAVAGTAVAFGGRGRPPIAAHVRRQGGGGDREVVTVWTLGGQGQLEMSLGFEVARSHGQRRLGNRWSLVPAGERRAPVKGKRARRGRGLDILVEVSAADNRGWDARSFARFIPPTDVRPILTPWGDRRAVVYYFEGRTPLEADAR